MTVLISTPKLGFTASIFFIFMRTNKAQRVRAGKSIANDLAQLELLCYPLYNTRNVPGSWHIVKKNKRQVPRSEHSQFDRKEERNQIKPANQVLPNRLVLHFEQPNASSTFAVYTIDSGQVHIRAWSQVQLRGKFTVCQLEMSPNSEGKV